MAGAGGRHVETLNPLHGKKLQFAYELHSAEVYWCEKSKDVCMLNSPTRDLAKKSLKPLGKFIGKAWKSISKIDLK